MKFCPNCVEALQKDKRKFGAVRLWLKCLVCGYRERDTDDPNYFQRIGTFIDRIHTRNASNHFKDVHQS